MILQSIDWAIIIGYFIVTVLIGLWASRQSGKSSVDFFLSGRNMPWWLLGTSMVATTFAADTPNFVTDVVRNDGVAGNWSWWAFLLTGMLTVFVYAKLWRRSGIVTDLEFYELRYSGKPAAFLRGFRAVYLGVIFNVLVMANVCLAAIKIGGVMFALSPIESLLIACSITVLYSVTGGLKGILFTDFFQFILAMVGTVLAAMFILDMPEIGGLDNLLNQAEVVKRKAFIPEGDQFYVLLFIPLAVQWWASYYPGAEPGGGGYIAQRMLAAKNEKHAVAATLLFNIAHYALRPWPWILIAFASLIIFPDLASLQEKFPHMDASIVKDDLAYPAMLTYLPAGLLGIMIASLFAGFMSTISSHLNWGASYIVNDVYHRFWKKDASQKELVFVGRLITVLMMLAGAIVALELENAKKAFDLVVLLGAGTGLIYILRWFWWRINAFTEIAAMVVSFIIAYYFTVEYEGDFSNVQKLVINLVVTTIAWLLATFLTRPTDEKVLVDFYNKIKPLSIGWNSVIASNNLKPTEERYLPKFQSMIMGVILVYAILFGMGYALYGQWNYAIIALAVSVFAALRIVRNWKAVS